MQPPIPCYEGDDPYLFVSYAHVDSELVYPQLSRLHALGANVWFDEGISPGSSWHSELADAIADCMLFVFFVTPRSVVSEVCTKELLFAQARGRRVLAIYLEETALPATLEFALGDIQAIMQYRIPEADYERKLGGALGQISSAPREDHLPSLQRTRSMPILWGSGVVIILIVAGLVVWQLRTSKNLSAQPVAVQAPHAKQPTIVVLPFDNLSSSVNDRYFTTGVYDDLLAKISRLPGLKVIGRTTAMRLKHSTKSLSEIAKEVGATHMLTGSVRRRANGEVHVTAELVSMSDQTELWSDVIDRPESRLLEIEQQVSSGVAGALHIHVNVASSNKEKIDPESYRRFAEARNIIDASTPGDINRALSLLRQVEQRNPTFADAYSYTAIGITLNKLDQLYAQAQVAANRALQLAPDSHLAQFAMAMTSSGDKAIPYFKKALKLDPNDSRVRLEYGLALVNQDHVKEALAEWHAAMQLDPLSASTQLAMVYVLPASGQWDETWRHLHRALELEPNNPYIVQQAASAYQTYGHLVDAVKLYVKLYEMHKDSVIANASIAGILMGLRDAGAATPWLSRLPPGAPTSYALECQQLHESGDTEGFYRKAKAFLDTYPNNGIAKTEYAYAIAEVARQAQRDKRYVESQNERKQAIKMLKDVLAPDFKDGHYHWKVGTRFTLAALMVVYKSLGDTQQANAIANDIIDAANDINNTWAGAQLQKGFALAVLGRDDEAIAAFRKQAKHPGLSLTANSFSALLFTPDNPYGLFQSLVSRPDFSQARDALFAIQNSWLKQLHTDLPQYF